MKVQRWLVVIAAAGFILLAQSSFTGRWLLEMTTPNGSKRELTFFLTQSGDTLSGAVLNGYRMQNISEGRVEGNQAAWIVATRSGQQERRTEYRAKLEGDRLRVGHAKDGGVDGRDLHGRSSEGPECTAGRGRALAKTERPSCDAVSAVLSRIGL